MFNRSRSRARRALAASAVGVAMVTMTAPTASAETIYIGARNCYDHFDTSIPNNVVTPGAWVVQNLTLHINSNIRNRCDPNSWVIDGTYTTGSVWEGGAHKGNGGPWWTHKYEGWYTRQIGYWAPTSVGMHEMRGYILSSQSTYPTPSYYNGVARTWLEVVSAPTPPRNARAGSYGVDRVQLLWDAPASDGGRGIQGYEIWRDGRVIRTAGAAERGIVDGPFPPGECHTYFVKAWNSVGFSGGSNSTTGCAPPDRTAPTVIPIRDRVADSNGWYNAPVGITWKATDPYPSSGTPTQPPATVADIQGRDVRYESAPSCDPARNCATGVDYISLDTTDPEVTATLSPNSASGWHNGDVTVDWTCLDALSGTEECADEVVTEEGIHELTRSSTDLAGNTTTGAVTVQIDREAPVTSSNAPPADAWQSGEVTITLDPSDARSGVATTTYRIDGGDPQTGTEVIVRGDGVHTVEFWSTDIAGNVEPPRQVEVRIDSIAPTITASVIPGANDAGWHNAPATVTWNCADERTEVVCPEQTVVDSDGEHTVTGTAIDEAGNTTTVEYTVRLDRVGPTLVPVPARAPDGDAGWYLSALDVAWTCTDDRSGVARCPAVDRLASEGEALTVTGTSVDAAGNSSTVTSAPFAVDLAGASAAVDEPRVNGLGVPAARAVTGTASDTMSGVARVEVRFTPSNGGAERIVAATCTGCGRLARNVTWQVPQTSLQRGSYVVSARAYDVAGHPAAWSAGVSMLLIV